jgi:hypothetical protein
VEKWDVGSRATCVKELLLDVEKRKKETFRLARRVEGLDELIRGIPKGEGVEEGRLRSGDREKEVIRGRRIFCQVAVRRTGYSGPDVARYLGVTTSAVNRLAASKESRELSKYA